MNGGERCGSDRDGVARDVHVGRSGVDHRRRVVDHHQVFGKVGRCGLVGRYFIVFSVADRGEGEVQRKAALGRQQHDLAQLA